MRTARLLTVSPSMHCSGGCLLLGGVCLGGCVCLSGVCLPGGRCLPLVPGCVSQHAMRQTPPLLKIMTDTCKNFTLPQTSFAGSNKISLTLLSTDPRVPKKINLSSLYCCNFSLFNCFVDQYTGILPLVEDRSVHPSLDPPVH